MNNSVYLISNLVPHFFVKLTNSDTGIPIIESIWEINPPIQVANVATLEKWNITYDYGSQSVMTLNNPHRDILATDMQSVSEH